MPLSKYQYINFNFDVSAYRLIGRELITDRITALFELVKNAYDANADNVTVEFIDVNPLSANSKIIISDDGLGMEFSDIKYRWMVIGTTSKRRQTTSPPPYNRRVAGKKGIGRFAVDKLGNKLVLKTKKQGSTELLCLETDWSLYSSLESKQLELAFEEEKEFFTDVKNKYWSEKGDIDKKGTTLEISLVSDPWTENDIKRAYKELSKMVSPKLKIKQSYPFNILLKSQYQGLEQKQVESNLIEFTTETVDLKFNKKEKYQEILSFEKGELKRIKVPERVFGYIEFTLYYFDQSNKEKYKRHFNTDIDGIKIYRDGIITTPFAEYVADQNKQKDILGIDKRRYSGFFDKLSSRDLLGFVEITEANNPNIIESTNRQDFVDNAAWAELKLFIIEQIQALEKFLSYKKNNVRESTKSSLGGANEELKAFKRELQEIKRISPKEVREKIKTIESSLGKIQGTVTKSLKDYSKLEQETKQRENLFFSLVSLQTYASMFSHMTRHTIGHILTSAEYFYKNYPNTALEERFKNIAKRIYSEMLKLRTGVDFMLKYAKSDLNIEEINIHELISYMFDNIYNDRLRQEEISWEIDVSNNLILSYNRKALEDIFDNLISNSIKALKDTKGKRMKCSAIINNEELTILFSDNGYGIKEEDKYRIFDIFFTTTAEDGGAGMGLYVVKTRIESMQGEISVVQNEFKPTGATFKITLPFKK